MGDLPRRGDLIALGAWAGLLAGLLDASGYWRGTIVYATHFVFNAHHWWLPLLTNLAMFTALGAVLEILAPRHRRKMSMLLVFLALLFPLCGRGDITNSTNQVVYCFNMTLLALGLTRVLSSQLAASEAFLRRHAGQMAVVCICLAGILLPPWPDRLSLAPVAAASQGAPNVLLIVMDTVRAQDLSLYGYARRTSPWLEKLAAHGVCFKNTFATSSWTLPSHVSMFTGNYASQVRTRMNGFSGGCPTLAEMLLALGYHTAGFVSNRRFCNACLGLSRGFSHYEDSTFPDQETLVCSSMSQAILGLCGLGHALDPPMRSAAEINRAFLAWQSTRGSAPFFAFLNYMEAHEAPTTVAHDDNWLATVAYDDAIMDMDEQIHRLLMELDRRKVLDNTLVIITSDHGEQLGEHGLWDHGNTLYVQLLRVPLVISCAARLRGGVTVDGAVSLYSIPATVMDLLGHPTSVFKGPTLAPSCRGPSPPPQEGVFAELFHNYRNVALRSVVLDNMQYIQRSFSPYEELYDLRTDAAEERNLASQPQFAAALQRCRAELERKRKAMNE